jgi:hypothetical protein
LIPQSNLSLLHIIIYPTIILNVCMFRSPETAISLTDNSHPIHTHIQKVLCKFSYMWEFILQMCQCKPWNKHGFYSAAVIYYLLLRSWQHISTMRGFCFFFSPWGAQLLKVFITINVRSMSYELLYHNLLCNAQCATWLVMPCEENISHVPFQHAARSRGMPSNPLSSINLYCNS